MTVGINGRFYAARLTGVQRFARELCAELYQRLDLVLFLPANARPPELPTSVRMVRGSASGQIWEQIELPRLAAAEDISTLLHPANTVPLSGTNNAVVVHDVLPLTHPQWFSRKYAMWHRHLVRPAFSRARTVFTCSQWSAREIARTCGVTPGRIHVITQGLTPFDKPADPDAVMQTLTRFGITAPYLLCVGDGDARKNIGLLTPVMSELTRTHPDLRLVTVGANNARIHPGGREPVHDWCHPVGSVDDAALRALYTGAIALCFPSLAEGFGRPPLEALACGTPAVAGDYGAAREVLGDAVPVLPHSPEPWVAALRELLKQPGRRAELVRRGAARLAPLQWSSTADQVIRVLQEGSIRQPAVFA